jgi:hypothetical protein
VLQVRQKAWLEARRSEPRCKRPVNLSLSLFGRFLDYDRCVRAEFVKKSAAAAAAKEEAGR